MDHALSVSSTIPWFAWIAIVAILGGSISGMVNTWFRHRERMALIRQGMSPDAIDEKANIPEL